MFLLFIFSLIGGFCSVMSFVFMPPFLNVAFGMFFLVLTILMLFLGRDMIALDKLWRAPPKSARSSSGSYSDSSDYGSSMSFDSSSSDSGGSDGGSD